MRGGQLVPRGLDDVDAIGVFVRGGLLRRHE